MGKAPDPLGITRSQEATASDPVSMRSFGENLCMVFHFQIGPQAATLWRLKSRNKVLKNCWAMGCGRG